VDPKCNGATCHNFTKCSLINPNCVCFSLSRGSGICGDGNVSCAKLPPCNTDTLTCNDPQSVCIVNSCCNKPVCYPLSSTGSSVCPTNSSNWWSKSFWTKFKFILFLFYLCFVSVFLHKIHTLYDASNKLHRKTYFFEEKKNYFVLCFFCERWVSQANYDAFRSCLRVSSGRFYFVT
jgi:hypothetical protein